MKISEYTLNHTKPKNVFVIRCLAIYYTKSIMDFFFLKMCLGHQL